MVYTTYDRTYLIYQNHQKCLISGIIIQPVVSFLEHIALAKSFSKREPQERILELKPFDSYGDFEEFTESIKLTQLKNWLHMEVHKW